MKNYSYVTLLTDDTYAYGVILLNESLKQVKSKYPLHVLITESVSEPVKEILKQNNIKFDLIDIISMPEEIYNYNKSINLKQAIIWKDQYTKFHLFNLTKYNKIVYLDADILILKNLDHLFNKPHMTAAIDGEYFNLYSKVFFNAGCIVIEPNNQEYLNILNYANNFNFTDFDKSQLP